MCCRASLSHYCCQHRGSTNASHCYVSFSLAPAGLPAGGLAWATAARAVDRGAASQALRAIAHLPWAQLLRVVECSSGMTVVCLPAAPVVSTLQCAFSAAHAGPAGMRLACLVGELALPQPAVAHCSALLCIVSTVPHLREREGRSRALRWEGRAARQRIIGQAAVKCARQLRREESDRLRSDGEGAQTAELWLRIRKRERMRPQIAHGRMSTMEGARACGARRDRARGQVCM